MRKYLFAAPMALAVFLPAVPAEAQRQARCVIASAGEQTWRGPCWFSAGRGGSFEVTPVRGSFAGGIGAISVHIHRPGVADVRGLTSGGINSRWGEARRSQRDRACWVGADFSVCVY